jgi:hypothetical protein
MGTISVNTSTNMTPLLTYDTLVHFGYTKNNFSLYNVDSIRSITIPNNSSLSHIYIKCLVTFDDGDTYKTWSVSNGFEGNYNYSDAWVNGISITDMISALTNIIVDGLMTKIGFAFAYKTDQVSIDYDPPSFGPISYLVAYNDILSSDNVDTLGNDVQTILDEFDNIDTSNNTKIKFLFSMTRDVDTKDVNISKWGFNKHQVIYGDSGAIEDFSTYLTSNNISTTGYNNSMNVRFKIWRDLDTTISPKLKSFTVSTKDNKFYTSNNVITNYTVKLIDNDITEIVKNSIGTKNLKISIIY